MNLDAMSREELAEMLGALLQREKDKESARELEQERERLVHDLQVHKVELEMQNRELRETQSSLEESRNRYADLYDFAPVAYFTFNVEGCIQEVNLTGATFIRRDRGQLIGKPFVSLVRLKEPARFWAILRQCAEARAPVTSELELSTSYADPVFVQAISVPVFDVTGHVVSFRTAFIDTSARKLAQIERDAALQSELRLRHRLEALDRTNIAVGRALASAEDSGTVHQVVVDHARAMTGADYAVLGTGSATEPGGPWFFSGIDSSVAEAFGKFSAGLATLRCALQREGALRVEDVRVHPISSVLPPDHPPVASFFAMPIRYRDQVRGILYLANEPGSREFTEEDERWIAMLAERVGVAMEIARLSEVEAREHARLAFLTDTAKELVSALRVEEMLQTIGNLVRRATVRFAQYCVVHLVEGDELLPSAAAHRDVAKESMLFKILRPVKISQPRPGGTIARVLRTRQPVLLLDPSVTEADLEIVPAPGLGSALSAKSIMLLPLVARERLIGIMTLGQPSSDARYDESDLAVAKELAFRVASAIDNTRLYEEAQNAIRSRDNLLAIVSHDLRSPLSAITLGSAYLARTSPPQGERRAGRKQVDVIRRSAARMDRLIEDLLTASTIESGRFTAEQTSTSVSELLEEAAQTLGPLVEAKSLHLELRVAADLPRVLCDRGRILQVLANLVGNAVKFTPTGGNVRIDAERREDVCISVSDTGPGIPASKLPHVFDRYWKGESSGRHGVGLGLYIAHGIVSAHGGRIWAESKVGEGSTFFFTLRVADPVN